jgi:predicted ATPase
MLRRIALERFRGFARLEADLAPVSVLLGPNSCGKSSILQAVRLACAALTWVLRQAPVPKRKESWIVLWDGLSIRQDEPFLPAAPTEELFLGRGDTGLTVTLSFDETDVVQELYVGLRYGQNSALKLDVWVKSERALEAIARLPARSRNVSPRLTEALVGKEPIAIAIPSFYGVVQQEPYVADARLEQLLGAGQQGSVVRNLVARLGGLKELSDFLRLSIGAEIVRSTSGQAIQETTDLAVHFRDDDGELELSSAGTGLVALLALFSVLKYQQPRAAQGRPLIFLLDEPEAHLHPKLQGDTGERLADLLTGFGAQALLATHSIEIINRLGRRRDAVLLSIDRSSTTAPAVPLTTEDQVIERLESFCDLTPFAGLQLLRSRRVLFHEGKTDRAILEGCARAYFANDPARLDRFRRWTFVELSSETNADAKDVFKKALAPLASTGAGVEPVRIVRVLDRDYTRQPAFPPQPDTTTPGIEELSVVWSRHSIESLFLDPPCLTAWLRLSLLGRPLAPSTADLEAWVAEGVAAANADAALTEAAAEQLFLLAIRKLTVGQLDSNKALVEARREASARVAKDPDIYQRGKDRAKHVLGYVRGKLPVSLQNRVRGDIADVIAYTTGATVLTGTALLPDEIRTLLDHLAK